MMLLICGDFGVTVGRGSVGIGGEGGFGEEGEADWGRDIWERGGGEDLEEEGDFGGQDHGYMGWVVLYLNYQRVNA